MDYQALFDRQQDYFYRELKQSDARTRIRKLKKMKKWVLTHQEDICKALHQDFKKPEHEVIMSEMLPVMIELKDAIANIRDWMRPKKVSAPMALITTSSKIVYEPKGVSLILAPWNFPFMLTIAPLISAVAAGCTAIVKPSEYSVHTSELIHKMITELFPEEEVACLLGDYKVAETLTAMPFDHIFFTGSPQVGKKVMRAAAENLSSITLELGGRNPVIVDKSAAMKDTARKLIWGKFFNAGQSCMSPNYVMVHEAVYDKFLEAIQHAFRKAFPEHHENMEASPDYARVISDKHQKRLVGLVDASVQNGARRLIGEDGKADSSFLSPTILCDIEVDSPVMKDELFGPIMPIIKVASVDAALDIIRKIEKPLGLYIFSRTRKNINKVINSTSSGNVLINETTIAFAHPELPFGGVNYSGLGKAHGHSGFLAFTNEKPVVKQTILLPSTILAHAPYKPWKTKILSLVMRWF